MKSLHLVGALLVILIGPALRAAPRAATGCSVNPGKYQGWDAQLVSNRWVKLTFVPQLGGRLMQVEFNGHSYLFSNPRFRGKYISPAEAKGDWINYGGDKIWPMPEGSQDENHWVIQSTAIDDLPYYFETLSEGRQCVVRLTGQTDAITGMRIVRTVSLSADTPEIRFHAVMENGTAHPITWSIQSVSQYNLEDQSHPDDFNRDLWAFTPRNPASSFPDGYHVRYGLAEDPAFSLADSLFRLQWTYFGNEVWLDTAAGWLAIVDKESRYGMIESFKVTPGADYPGNTTVIFYKNGPSVRFDRKGMASITEASPVTVPYYMEAEINSPIVTLQPGETYAFDTQWHPLAIAAEPKEMHSSGVTTQRLRATIHGENLHLQGAFSVFAPGNLIALFFSNSGKQIGQADLQAVDPGQPVSLDLSLPVTQTIERVSVKLYGVDNQDYGILSTTQIEK
jgi:hypothetical protein